MKRVLSWVLAIFLVLIFEIPHASADNEKVSGDFSYQLKGNGTAIITGYHGKENEDIYIPKIIDGYTVTAIGEKAFTKYIIDFDLMIGLKVKNLLIPDTVVSIGAKAFMGMELEAKSITIPASVQHIGPGAFSDISGLSQFVVAKENSVYATIDGVLYNKVEKELVAFPKGLCIGITNVDVSIPEGIKSIGDYAFFRCGEAINGLKLRLPQTLERIGAYAFSGCHMAQGGGKISLKQLKMPASLKELGEGAFSGCSCDGIDFSETEITIIPYLAFNYYKGAFGGEIILPSKLVSIENNAFSYAEYSHINEMPSTLVTIGDKAFFSTNYLLPSNLVLPEGLQSIGSSAFAESKSLESLTLPSSLRSIGDNMCDRTKVSIDAPAGSYASLWASENGYTSNGEEDTSWLN